MKGTSRFNIYGTTFPTTTPGVLDPSYTCTVNGISVDPQSPATAWPRNGALLFTGGGPDQGNHTVFLTALSNTSAFYFDFLQYLPDANSNPEEPTVNIEHADLAVEYLNGAWTAELYGMMTEQKDAKMRISFTGVVHSPR